MRAFTRPRGLTVSSVLQKGMRVTPGPLPVLTALRACVLQVTQLGHLSWSHHALPLPHTLFLAFPVQVRFHLGHIMPEPQGTVDELQLRVKTAPAVGQQTYRW